MKFESGKGTYSKFFTSVPQDLFTSVPQDGRIKRVSVHHAAKKGEKVL